MTEKSTKSHKDAAWKAFSLYIRTRDCLLTTQDPTRGLCVTCPSLIWLKEGSAGHFLAGRGNSLLFDERGTHLQCGNCNYNLAGNQRVYEQYMIENYGQEVVDELHALRHVAVKMTSSDFKAVQREYKQKLGELLNGQKTI